MRSKIPNKTTENSIFTGLAPTGFVDFYFGPHVIFYPDTVGGNRLI
jgi:hypothetical protein